MHNRMRKIFRSTLGFSLVELIMVIAIMAIIASVVVPTFFSLRASATENEKHGYYNDVVDQARAMVAAYNSALADGETPRLAGYNITTARAMQEFLRSANNRPETYDVVVVTKEIASADYASNFNYIDTIVLCIQFYGPNARNEQQLITRDISATNKNVPCSPEYGDKGISPTSCTLVSANYYQVGDKKPKTWTMSAS